MTPDSVKAEYRRMIDIVGESVTMRRYSGTPRVADDAAVQARVMGFDPTDLVADIKQGDRKVIMLVADLETADWPIPPRIGDKVVIRDRELNVEAVDDNTRRFAGEIIAYDLRVRG